MSGFTPGDLIYRSKPHVYVLNNACRGKRCDNCFAESEGLKRCSQCTFVYFCNRNCQAESWDTHKMECKYIKKISPVQPSFILRLLALILFKIKKFGLEEPSEIIYGHKMNFQRLVSHADEINQNPKAYKLMRGLLKELKQYVGVSNIPPESEYIEIFGKMHVNSFSIYDFEDAQHVGTGIYLGASIFDHSCDPDAEVVWNGIELFIRAVKEIPHTDVTKIYIRYTDQLQLQKERQDYLKEQYFFNCQCSRCSSTFYEDLMTKTIVDKREVEDQVIKLKEGIECIKKMKENGVSTSIIYEACLKELEKQEGLLAETHILRLRLLELLMDACIDSKQWADAFAYGEKLTVLYKMYCGKHHPFLGIHLFNVGMALHFQGLTESAKSNLLQAKEILKVTHGSDHPSYGNVAVILSKLLAL